MKIPPYFCSIINDMEVIKKYTVIQMNSTVVDFTMQPTFTFGDIEGPYYSLEYPEIEFDTEDEAIKYAHDKNKYARWLIIPLITFKL